MSVLVTGASGFIGRHFLSSAEARGVSLRPVFRSADQIGSWRDAVIAGDLTAYEDWRRAFTGVDAVVHLAARAHRNRRNQRRRPAPWLQEGAQGPRNLPDRLANGKDSLRMTASPSCAAASSLTKG